jgi:integrase
MPADTRGSVYKTRTGYGIRWPEDGKRMHHSGFETKTAARRWFADNVAPRLRRSAPSAEITFEAFCDVFLERHGATVAPATKRTLEERLASARERFGTWTLRELEGAVDDVAKWRSMLPDTSRYRLTSALRQALAAAVRWHYIGVNPAVEAGRNPQPRLEELHPFTREQVDAIAVELGRAYGPLAIFAAETGLRTNEWVALERRDVDRGGRAVTVQRGIADGRLTPYPKTQRSRRRVPLTARAFEAIEALPPRLDTALLFPAPKGGPIGLDTWRTREWYPALDAAGIERRGPYALRHTFATEALASGASRSSSSRGSWARRSR